MPATKGSVTPRVDATATAASAAVPPWRRTFRPARVAYSLSEATAPPDPTATARFAGGTAASAAAGMMLIAGTLPASAQTTSDTKRRDLTGLGCPDPGAFMHVWAADWLGCRACPP